MGRREGGMEGGEREGGGGELGDENQLRHSIFSRMAENSPCTLSP